MKEKMSIGTLWRERKTGLLIFWEKTVYLKGQRTVRWPRIDI